MAERAAVRVENLSGNARLALDDLFFFGLYYWGLQLEEKPHRWMCDELMKTLTMEKTPYLMMDVPRGCYKTSIVTCGAVWQYLRQWLLFDNPYHRIVYASNTLELGEAFLTLIENVTRDGGLEGRIDRDFGKLWKSPDKTNRKSSRHKYGIVMKPRMDRGEIAAVKEPNFFIASIGRRVIGHHADGAILDDLNNEDNVSTPDRLMKTHRFYRQIFPLISERDRAGNPAHVWMCCTIWHDNDVRGMIIREEQEKKTDDGGYVSPWRIVKAKARLDDGTLFFPSKLSEKTLESLKEKMGREYYGAYEGEVVTERDSVATEEQIRFKPREHFPPLRWGRITVDPNQHNEAKSAGCYAAIVCGGYDRFSQLWITDIRASRNWGTKELIDELYAVQETYPSWPMFIENEHMTHFDHAVGLEYVARMEAAAQNAVPGSGPQRVVRPRINWFNADRHRSKYDRYMALQPRFKAGAIFFAEEIPRKIKMELQTELMRGQASRFNDIIDALAMMENGVMPKYEADGRPRGLAPVKPEDEMAQPPKKTWSSAFGPLMAAVGDD